MDALPDELLVEILARVPERTRCLATCWRWVRVAETVVPWNVWPLMGYDDMLEFVPPLSLQEEDGDLVLSLPPWLRGGHLPRISVQPPPDDNDNHTILAHLVMPGTPLGSAGRSWNLYSDNNYHRDDYLQTLCTHVMALQRDCPELIAWSCSIITHPRHWEDDAVPGAPRVHLAPYFFLPALRHWLGRGGHGTPHQANVDGNVRSVLDLANTVGSARGEHPTKSIGERLGYAFASPLRPLLSWRRPAPDPAAWLAPDAISAVPTYEYQRAAAAWMLALEDDSRFHLEKTPEGRQPLWPVARRSLSVARYFLYPPDDLRTVFYDQFYAPVQAEEAGGEFVTFEANGGLLADETGLGKTRTVLLAVASALARQERLSGHRMLVTDTTHYLTTRPRCEGAHAPGLRQYPGHGPLVRTRATLVLCPSQCFSHWLQEARHVLPADARVLGLSTLSDHEACTLGMLMEADLVVVTTAFLTNRHHYWRHLCARWHGEALLQASEDDPAGAFMRRNVFDSTEERHRAFWAVHRLTDPHTLRAPMLDLLDWPRLVLDEAHEVLYDTSSNNSGLPVSRLWVHLRLLSARWRWAVSATPLLGSPHNRAVEERLFEAFLGVSNLTFYPETTRLALAEVLVDRIVWRNTRLNVAREHWVPPPCHETVVVDLCPRERALLTVLPGKRARAAVATYLACPDPRYAEHPPGVGTYMVARGYARAYDPERATHKEKERVRAAQRAASTPGAPGVFGMARSVDHLWAAWRQHYEARAAFAARRVAECRAVEHDRQWTVRNKLLKYERVRARARELATALAERYPRLASGSGGRAAEPRFGSKVDAVLAYVQRQLASAPDVCFLLASAHRVVLQLYQRVLATRGVTSVYFGTNNVLAKNKALRALAAPDSAVRVVLLDTSASNSGANLVRASHVILVDTLGLDTTRASLDALETQVIGRVYRQNQTRPMRVTRFLCRGTPEVDRAKALGLIADTTPMGGERT